VWSWNAAIAAVCGDTVIWKPAEPTPLTAIAVQHIANRVMADHGLTGIFTLAGRHRAAGRRSDAAGPRLPLISFTGSTRVGRHVAQTVAARFGKTILELGGNNAIIVAPTPTSTGRARHPVRRRRHGRASAAPPRGASSRTAASPPLVDRLVRPTGRCRSAIRWLPRAR
jgi:hypothetical protein